MKWLRLYHSVLNDPKIQALEPADFKLFINLLLIAGEKDQGGALPTLNELSFLSRVRADRLQRRLHSLAVAGCIDHNGEGGEWSIHDWKQWKYGSDDEPANRCGSTQWAALREAVFLRDNYTCSYCNSSGVRLECDHRIPVSRGGSDFLDNLTTSCFACNRAKRAKTDEEFITFRNRIEVVN